MAETARQLRLVRFGDFEVDLRSGELRKAGVKLKFGGQPFQVLTILLERPGDVVTREELQKRLWPDTFVDVDHNLNTAINKIREMLGDSAESPCFVETLPRRGYRFIAPVYGDLPISEHTDENVWSAQPVMRRTPLVYGLAILGVATVMMSGLAFWRHVFRTPNAPKVLRIKQLTNDGQAKMGPMATDGSRVYFNEVLRGPRYVVGQVSVNGGEAIPLAISLKHPRLLGMSKEGTEFLVGDDFWDGGSLWMQPVAGGSPRRVGTVYGTGAGFGPDQTTIIVGTEHEVDSMKRDGSSSRKLLSSEDATSYFRFSPDARVFRFTDFDYPSTTKTIMEAAADGTLLRKMFAGCCGEWTPDGRFFIFQDISEDRNDLWALPEDKSFWRKKDDQKPIQLTRGPLDFQYPLPSKDGERIFAIGTSRRAELARYDTRSNQFLSYLPEISPDTASFSQEGQWVAFTSYFDSTLWRSKIDGTQRLQLTFPPMQVFLPRWSPDGKQIAFNAKLPGTVWNIYIVQSEGGTPERILPSDENQMDANWSPDGNSLIFASNKVPNKSSYIIDLKSRHVSTLPDSIGLFSPHWSPDGRYIAAIKTEGQTLMLFDFATQKWTEVFASPMGYENWSRDGQYIYFENFTSQDASFHIRRLRVNDRKVEEITDLSKVVRLTDSEYAAYWLGIAPDDSPLVSRAISTQEVYALEMEWP